MKKIILTISLVIILNFIYLSFAYSQTTNVNIRAYVPETETNKQVNTQTKQVPSVLTKENKYKYFFDKFWQAEENSLQTETINGAQTVYDRIFSNLLMWVLLFIIAVLLALIIKLSEIVYKKVKLWLKK